MAYPVCLMKVYLSRWVCLDSESNLERFAAEAERAVGAGASIVVFPELFLTGYSRSVDLTEVRELFARISGGAPFALACALQLPDRVSACGVVSGAAPMELAMREFVPAFRWQFAVARRFPWLIRPLLWYRTGRHYMMDYETARAAFEAGLENAAEPDRAFKDDPGNALTVHMIREAFRQGMRGPSFEGRLLVQDWGFRLEDVTHEHVYLWHGDKDIQAPAAAARVVAERIPNCEATFFPGEAHASAVVHHTEEMLRTLGQW